MIGFWQFIRLNFPDYRIRLPVCLFHYHDTFCKLQESFYSWEKLSVQLCKTLQHSQDIFNGISDVNSPIGCLSLNPLKVSFRCFWPTSPWTIINKLVATPNCRYQWNFTFLVLSLASTVIQSSAVSDSLFLLLFE